MKKASEPLCLTSRSGLSPWGESSEPRGSGADREYEFIRLVVTPTSYNRIAGQSVERLAALSDGVFAVAMTLLVLDLRAPATEMVHNERDLWRALVALSPPLVMYMMTFLALGIFWVGPQ